MVDHHTSFYHDDLSLPGCDTMANAAAASRFHLGPARKCCVTGGTRGIGRAIVDEFVSLGAQVSGLQQLSCSSCTSPGRCIQLQRTTTARCSSVPVVQPMWRPP